MVDQAQVTPTNGHAELPPRAMARSTAELLHDMVTLAELQGKLALVDLREGIVKLLMPVALVAVGLGLALGCIPIALMTLALTLERFTKLPPPACFGISLAVGIVLAAVFVMPAIVRVRTGLRMFDRSLAEWRRNKQWVMETLRRASRSGASRPTSPAGPW